MDSCSATTLDPRAVYDATMASRAQQHQKADGQSAVRLIDSAGTVAAGAAAATAALANRPMPTGATVSIRV